MRRLTKLIAPAVAALLSACATTGSVESASEGASQPVPTAQQLLVAGAFERMLAPSWSEAQQKAIVLIGYYSGAAALCDDVHIDPKKVAEVVQSQFSPPANLAAKEIEHREDILTMHIGIATGLTMGAHVETLPKFCNEVVTNRHNFATPLLKSEAAK